MRKIIITHMHLPIKLLQSLLSSNSFINVFIEDQSDNDNIYLKKMQGIQKNNIQ